MAANSEKLSLNCQEINNLATESSSKDVETIETGADAIQQSPDPEIKPKGFIAGKKLPLTGEMPGAQDTLYLCNFRVSVDGDWLCLKQLEDVEFEQGSLLAPLSPPSPIEPFSLLAARDPMLIERSNLVNISKLVVKELIDTSQKYGRMLDSDHLPLQHFFIVLEHVLRHGLKPKKGLLGPKKELWDILQLVEKFSTDAADTTATVRDLPTVATAMGRARAWLRLSLMQKKLADYVKVLVDRKEDVLAEYFEPDALLMSDEAFIIIGLLVGLNVIDCNLCVKEEDLDCQQGMINFSLYLRSSHNYYQPANNILDPDNMTTVLDQKNYIEELNRHLNATVSNLESRVESLQTTNALMKEDLDIAHKNLALVNEENARLKRGDPRMLPPLDQGGGQREKQMKAEIESMKGEVAAEVKAVQAELEAEKKKRLEVEKELKLQVSMKSEMEVAMKLLEKDIHEKQATIGSLQKQLDEIKVINLEMFKKLQDCESSLKQKTELVSKLEVKTASINESHLALEDKLAGADQRRVVAEAEVRNLAKAAQEHLATVSSLEGELKVERDWRMSLEETQMKDRESIAVLSAEVSELKGSATNYLKLKEEFRLLQEEKKILQEQCRLHELTLEELGSQLSTSKLKLVDLQEEARAKMDGQWAKDKEAVACRACSKEFNLTRRKHHCRNCGEIFCNACSDNNFLLPSSARPVRVCDTCHVFLIARNSVL